MQLNKGNVYVDGVFDLFHEGHINLLRRAAGYGKLIVGVHSDEFVTGYKRKPVIPEATRYMVVEACRYVDCVIKGVGTLTEEMIDTYKIELVLHGDDFSYEDVQVHYLAALNRGIFKYLPYTQNVSSTKIIQEIEKRFSNSSIYHRL